MFFFRKPKTKAQVCEEIAAELRERGYPAATADQVICAMDTWLAGGEATSGGIVAILAVFQFEGIGRKKLLRLEP